MTATMTRNFECFALRAETAADLMTLNPVSIPGEMTVREAAAVLTDKEISAVPVIDDAGRPVGVLTHTDIVRHERHKSMFVPKDVKRFRETETALASGERLPKGFEVELTDPTCVKEIMTPTVLAVPEDATVERVLTDFLAFKVHHLFVVDDAGVLVGVISTFDFLRKLAAEKR
jgi:CBS domain-containing protein